MKFFFFKLTIIILARVSGASGVLVRHASSGQEGKTEKVYPPNVPGFKYVNAEDPDMSFKEMSNRAAQTLFWTELARGFAVTLAHIFKVRSDISVYLKENKYYNFVFVN